MRPDEREVLIRYRLEQAYSALRQAEILAREAEWSGVVNRAYYAMFYASLALLLTRGLGASKHSGVLALVNREFVRPGLFPREMSRLLRDAFNQRQKADYSELCPTDRETAQQMLSHARQFVEAVERAVPGLLG